ncbi:multidrug efflux SMR transporter [Helicobacter magdeburgensis]|uniref:Multidrug efflux SMR transporter n=2 Tax=Helicobacter TaxID=209 RepID=A0A4U8SXS1_9HELI|nr:MULTISPECIES: multidrug efflux SMR transporter [Helicobacter]TLD91790.1 multidrug efflux SMR transporter [Helicobacter magdeburgensis]BDB67161.1 multidrug resistance protein [Helicobacter cinaedi]STP10467.1 efflux protein [Helicobacter cinaedi]
MTWLFSTKEGALVFVLVAALLDIVANLFLKKSNSFTHKGYAIACVVMVWVAFSALAVAIQILPLSTAYATWGAVGIIGTALGGYIFFKENLGTLGYIGIAMVVCAVVLLNWGD